jgi:hypothetical protein
VDLDDDEDVDRCLHEGSLDYRLMNCASDKRRAFVLQHGYIGLGHPCLQLGDPVCVFPVAVIPFVLRPNRLHFRLLGEAYAHGIMKESVSALGKTEWFELS